MSTLPPHNARATPRAMTLIEVLAVMVIIGILATFAVPCYQRACQQTSVDTAAQYLRCILAAQRLSRLETGRYSADLATLASEKLLDPAIADGQDRGFTYSVSSDLNGTTFQATASRVTGSWRGQLRIDQAGALSGQVTGPGGAILTPSPY